MLPFHSGSFKIAQKAGVPLVIASISGSEKIKRNLFLRRYWYCDAISDIARRYGLSESKVKSSLARSRKALGEALRREGYDV